MHKAEVVMNLNTPEIRPNVSKRAFWDIEFNTIDWEHNTQYLIIRVIERGKLQDIIELIKFYGKERMKDELKSASHLPIRTYQFAKTYFSLTTNDFRCSISETILIRRQICKCEPLSSATFYSKSSIVTD